MDLRGDPETREKAERLFNATTYVRRMSSQFRLSVTDRVVSDCDVRAVHPTQMAELFANISSNI